MSKKRPKPVRTASALPVTATSFIPPTPAADARIRGMKALSAGDRVSALKLFETSASLEPNLVENHLNLAVVRRAMGDMTGMLAALDQALNLDPRELIAHLLRGIYFEDQGDIVTAGACYNAALAIAPPMDEVPPDFRPMLRRAQAAQDRFMTEHARVVDGHLAQSLERFRDQRLDRFQQSVDVYLGRKRMYQRQPHNFYYPGLPETQFYDRRDFPWLGPIEAATDIIRQEFLAILERNEGFTPYIQYPSNRPLDQWAELNLNPRWNAYHLIQDGHVVQDHAALCPQTMALLATSPAARLPRRSPNAMFSVLAPKTKIPPHTGVTNVRLVVHVPLIIPDNCLYRVGNDTREWKLGEAFIFDDTIDHEANNDSDQTRVVLIFDIWHPDISPAEQALIGDFFEGVDAFIGGPPKQT